MYPFGLLKSLGENIIHVRHMNDFNDKRFH